MSTIVNPSQERFKLIPAVYLLLRRKNEVLLLRRAQTGYQDGMYSFVAGHLEGNERGTVAMQREAKEEAGIDIDLENIKFVHLTHRLGRNGGQERMDIFYEARVWRGKITNMEPHKCDDLSWHPITNPPENTIPLIKLVLQDVLKGVTYSEYDQEPA